MWGLCCLVLLPAQFAIHSVLFTVLSTVKLVQREAGHCRCLPRFGIKGAVKTVTLPSLLSCKGTHLRLPVHARQNVQSLQHFSTLFSHLCQITFLIYSYVFHGHFIRLPDQSVERERLVVTSACLFSDQEGSSNSLFQSTNLAYAYYAIKTKTRAASSMIAIRTGYLPNTIPGSYLYTLYMVKCSKAPHCVKMFFLPNVK